MYDVMVKEGKFSPVLFKYPGRQFGAAKPFVLFNNFTGEEVLLPQDSSDGTCKNNFAKLAE